MTVAFYMNCVSTHQLPLAREVAKLVDSGQCVVDSNFVYVYEGEGDQAYQRVDDVGNIKVKVKGEGEQWIENSDLLLSGLRDLELFERRAKKGLKTFYTSERWFKPILVGSGKWVVGSLPGWVRMFVPGYRRMVKRFVAWANGDPGARVLAIGPWAKGDFLRMGVKEEKIVDWGYFVAPSELEVKVGGEGEERRVDDSNKRSGDRFPVGDRFPLKVLWAGRDIPLKHVRDIERAVALANARLVGSGQWVVDSGKCVVGSEGPISFTKLTGVTPAEVRKAMREHDVFVLASNGYEGWGAVVSEALEEGMNVIGTWECGACPTLLPKERLYHCGDMRELARLLALEVEERGGGGQRMLPPCSIGEWTAKKAAERLCALARGVSG